VTVATLIRLGLNPIWGNRFPYLVFFPAIVVAGLYGGLGPGLLSVVLSAGSVILFVLSLSGAFQAGGADDATGLTAFAVTGILLAAIAAAQRDARFSSLANAAQALAAGRALRISEQRFVTTLRSIGDAVLATDQQGRVTFLNAVAEQLTGWPEGEAIGHDVHEIFPILSETNRQPVQNPIDRVFREGIIVGLANHTILPSRDGTEYAIDDSGAPIRDEAGAIVGAVLIFRDISERRQLEREQEALARREAVENRIGEALRANLPPREIQARATAALGESLGADRCYLTLVNPGINGSVISDEWRRDPALSPVPGESALPPPSVLVRISPGGQPAVLEDCETAPLLTEEERDLYHRVGVRAAIILGLFEDNALIATLTVAMATAPRMWTEAEIALVQSVATLTLAAAESARLRDQEHNIAVRLQEILRPTLPREQIPGLDVHSYYLAALEESSLGGDFFDVFPLSDGRHAMVVADLSGKGLQAAAQVALVRYMLRALLYIHDGVDQGIAAAMNQLNLVLADRDLIMGFATVFVAVFDTGEHTLRYVCCGQEPGLHYRRDARETQQLAPTGPVLGSFPDAVFEEHQTTLRPGDAVAIFTDGLTECGPSRRELLGIAGVTALWEEGFVGDALPTAAAVSERLVQGALEYSGGKLSDDLCLLTLVAQPGHPDEKVKDQDLVQGPSVHPGQQKAGIVLE
ncbi:MAG: SpoIIE family protein phosphatase, partial [Cytophagales bacterium]|nr:SpoIIE family protein phosphatase [Armatimonadota bacterium]